jgi:hypothetical protein
MHRSIEGIAEFSLGGTELGALLSAKPISEERLRRSLDVTNQIQRQVTAAIQLGGNFAVAITDRVSEVRRHR